ncbi:hypothetical protein CVT24_007669 [Panaeolus cyanescens]|uniref:F-box domain-containing protein n=1 Tax=Panaeolus cyanescens TaxID=181874 RepID=A0A409VRL1_9AGAR|nr:hypothetical protein CVT24_007669 [Panaeolus cyanescens]
MSLPLAIASTQKPGKIHLPLEVQYRILGNLWNEKPFLSECSVVCKAWLPICRELLFAQVVLRSDFAQFLQKSTGNTPFIARYIRKVVFRGNVSWPDTVYLDFSILKFPYLEQLTFQRSRFQKAPGKCPSCPPSGFSSVTRLELSSTNFTSFAMFAKYIELLSSLQDLKLDNISWNQLGLNFCDNDHVILKWIRYGIISDAPLDTTTEPRRPLDRLSCLSLPDVLPSEISQMTSFVATISKPLEHLELGFVVNGADQSNNSAIQTASEILSALNLQSFILSQINLFQFPLFPPSITPPTSSSSSASYVSHSPYAWILSLLEAALSNKLTHLTMKVWLSSEAQMSLLNWPVVDCIISASKLSTLRFQIFGIDRDFGIVQDWFKTRLSLITASSDMIIEFEFWDTAT